MSALAQALALSASILSSETRLLSDEAIEGGRESLLYSVQNIKKDYVVNWHHDQLAEALEAVQRGEITRLMVFMPPRMGKSELVSRQFPAWCMGKNPDEKIIACSYGATLAGDMGMDVQNIMGSEEYREMFETRLKSGVEARKGSKKVKETNLKFDVVNGTGYYIGAGVGGSITGRGFSLGIIDDCCKNRDDADSETKQKRDWNWYTSTFYPRREGAMSTGGCDRIVMCVTPWNRNDLSGRILEHAEEMGEEWVVIRFPAVKDDGDAGIYESSSRFTDPRELGEPLWAARLGLVELAKVRKLSPTDWTSLWCCRPSAAKGNIFQKHWWKLYDELPQGRSVDTFSLDCAFGDGPNSSFVVLQRWARYGPDHYLVDQRRKRRDFSETESLCDDQFEKHPEARKKLIEDKANGPAIISKFKRKYSGLVPVTPRGSKKARALAVQGLVEGGNVYLPRHADWREDFINELAAFPNGKNDDQVDAMTQYLDSVSAKRSVDFLRSLQSARMH